MASDYINALLKKEVTRTPVWVMRQAGRYLPEYRETRKKAGDFLSLCKSSELACEVTLQPLERFDLDAAILFSDILTIPDAMGLGLYFVEGEGPKFYKPLTTLGDIDRLSKPDVGSELAYVSEAVSVIKKNLKGRVPIIGFAGSPWTLATYMVEGGSSKSFSKVKGLMFENPNHMHQLLNVLAETVIDYLNNQIEAGENPKLFKGSSSYGNGEQRRDFIFVGDVVKVNLWMLENPEVSGIFNMGTGNCQSFKEVAESVLDYHGKGEIEFIPFPDHLKGSYQSFTKQI